MKLVEVQWLDAIGNADLKPREKLPPATAKTVGYLWEDADDYITVAGELFEDGTARAVTTIPRVCVLKVQKLK